MFSLLEDKSSISAAQKRLEATLLKALPNRSVRNIGYPSKTVPDVRIWTDLKYWHRAADQNDLGQRNPRRLNWFGLLKENGSLDITVEINVPYEGCNGNIAGSFARDDSTGAIYLIHDGAVGGGTPGVGQKAFLAWRGEELEVVVSSRGRRQGVAVMPIEGPRAFQSLTRYIDSIVDFKKAARQGDLDTPSFAKKLRAWRAYYDEPGGRRRGKRSPYFDYVSRHSDIVRAVKEWREQQPLPRNGKIVKSVLIDLGVVIGGRLAEVYEVKPDTSRQSIYTAIGQLMVHGSGGACSKTIVLPSDQPILGDIKAALTRLGINIVRFELTKTSATIVSGGFD